MNDTQSECNERPSLFVGIDWADKAHECYIIDATGNGTHQSFNQTPEAIEEWVSKLRAMAGDRPIAIMLELSKGPLIYALMHRPGILLYPVNPQQFASYRESYPGGKSKSDRSDARYLARMLRERITVLKPWIADDEPTRLLAMLSEHRRKIVNAQVSLRQQLIAHLKSYFPLLLELFGDCGRLDLLLSIIARWSDLKKLQRADRKLVDRVLREGGIRSEEQRERIIQQIRSATPLTIDAALIEPLAMTCELLAKQIQASCKSISSFDEKIAEGIRKHPDGHLFTCLRGAGPTLATRLLCAFGSQKDRWDDADEIACFSGIAPVTK